MFNARQRDATMRRDMDVIFVLLTPQSSHCAATGPIYTIWIVIDYLTTRATYIWIMDQTRAAPRV